MPELPLTQWDYLSWLFLQLTMTWCPQLFHFNSKTNGIVLGIKSWLIVEKAKTDSPIELEAILALIPLLLCCESNTLVLSRFFFLFFFSYAADLSLFLETGKGLTCAVFTESVDLRPDWWIWHYILESSVELLPGAKKDGFCLSSSQSLWCAKWSGVI